MPSGFKFPIELYVEATEKTGVWKAIYVLSIIIPIIQYGGVLAGYLYSVQLFVVLFIVSLIVNLGLTILLTVDVSYVNRKTAWDPLLILYSVGSFAPFGANTYIIMSYSFKRYQAFSGSL